MSDETKEKIAELTTAAKATVWKYFGAMMLEQKGDGKAVSLGRIAFLVLFGIALWKWGLENIDPPDTMMTTLYSLLGYIGVGKVAHTVGGAISKQ